MKTQSHEILLMDVKKVAATLDVSVPTIWRWVKSGDFPTPIKIGGSTRWRRTEIIAMIEREAA